MSGFEYIPKCGKIYVVTLPSTNAWTQILTEAQAKSCRGLKIKSRFTFGQNQPKYFDYAFSATPDETGSVSDGTGYGTNSGSGFGDVFSPSSGMYARTTQSGVVLEVQVYD
jgi:hypothetical protein